MNFIIYDLEATCCENNEFPREEMEIIEIGAIKINSDGNIVDTFDIFVKPMLHTTLTQFCKDLTTIKQTDVDNGKNFKEASDLFLKWISDDYSQEYALISWGNFDKNQFIRDSQLSKLNSYWIKNCFNLKEKYSTEILNAKKQFGLQKALKKEGLEFTGTCHRGIDDANNIAKIFKKYFYKWELGEQNPPLAKG